MKTLKALYHSFKFGHKIYVEDYYWINKKKLKCECGKIFN